MPVRDPLRNEPMRRGAKRARRRALVNLVNPKFAGKSHPRLADRTRTLLAKLTFFQLIIGYLSLVAATAIAGGLALWVTAPDGTFSGFTACVSASFFTLIGMAPDTVDPSTAKGLFKWVIALIGLSSILIPAVFLGAIVFRVFVRDKIFVFRHRPSLVTRNNVGMNGQYLAIRLYSSSPLLVVDIHFRIYFRHTDRSRSLVINQPVKLHNEDWPVADTHVPFTVYIPLESGDVEGDRLVSIQSTATCEDAKLIVHVSGTAPQLGSDFNEVHYVDIPDDLVPGDFQDIDVLYDGKGPDWPGWDHFEDEVAIP